MLLTEKEALTKRCQESFGPGLWTTPDGAPMPTECGGAVMVVTSPSHCIGSACMAWRWRFPALGYCGKAGLA